MSEGSMAEGAAGCLLAGLGAPTAAIVWAPRAASRVRGGFEGQGRDLGVLFVDLPLVTLGGALVPLLAWALVLRLTRNPWLAVLVAVSAFGLGLWGLTEWWPPARPQHGPSL
ncbi:hypothetical protein AB0J21_12080 [Streptomyces sp. NPDC049954]|uniref:hypothetical protein n=1 Tax=Streptomyces sp. NPDC049954 TaxID=3155779 RepID=UPI00343DB588